MGFALIKGEQHNSDEDWSELLGIDFSKFDAVFVEHHEDKEQRNELKYVLYFTVFVLYDKFAGFAYHDNERIERICNHLEIEFEDNIDLNFYDTFDEISTTWVVLSFVISLLFALIAGLIFFRSTPSTVVVAQISLNHATAVLVFIVAFYLLNFGLIEFIGTFSRDEHMANELINRSQDNGYERIILLCGEMHRPVILRILEQEGWSVKELPSKTVISRILKPIKVMRLLVWEHVFEKNFVRRFV